MIHGQALTMGLLGRTREIRLQLPGALTTIYISKIIDLYFQVTSGLFYSSSIFFLITFNHSYYCLPSSVNARLNQERYLTKSGLTNQIWRFHHGSYGRVAEILLPCVTCPPNFAALLAANPFSLVSAPSRTSSAKTRSNMLFLFRAFAFLSLTDPCTT
jgi:hypothetical protein